MKRRIGKIFLVAVGVIFAGLLGLAAIYHNRIYPGIRIGPIAVGGLKAEQAEAKLVKAIEDYQRHFPMAFSDGEEWYAISWDASGVTYDVEASVQQALNMGRKNLTINRSAQVELLTTINDELLTSVGASLAAQIDVPAVPSRLEVVPDHSGGTKAQAILGQTGRILDQQTWKQRMKQSLGKLSLPETQLPVIEDGESITPDQILKTETTANTILKSKLTLTFVPEADAEPEQTWELNGPDLIKFIRFNDSFDQQLIREYLTGVAEAVNRPAKDAKFQFDEQTAKVTEFVPAENGIVIKVDESAELINQALTRLGQNQTVEPVKLVFEAVKPAVALDEVNRMGIVEKIGVGRSTYKGSIASRVHNVALAAARINGTLIRPGEEFSFNQAVGEISAATGYQAAYIIQNGRTELGDGGGVCQDSTTVFRAALDAGLPITVRRGHAYRVGYYEQDSKPGLDATVFSPSTDLKFLNDTPGHILIQAEADSANRRLTVTFFGTSDGRKSEILDHTVWDVTPPPPDVYVDDPTLAPGQVKQIDWKAAGAKTKFTYRVTRNGEVLQDKVFLTTYKAWAAVYLRGPQP